MNIGEVARRSGVPAKTIRYYEEIGLFKPLRDLNRYREFRKRDMRILAFLGCARSLGFKIPDCRKLVDLFDNETSSCDAIQKAVEVYLARIQLKINELEDMRKSLTQLMRSC